VDGLHRKSGIPKDKITEVHGNTNLELCRKCGKDYMRDFRVRTSKHVHKHDTGRFCDNKECKGNLYDTIINFNESLRDEDLEVGFDHGWNADLMLCLGSSLRVHPAAAMAEATIQRGKNMVIVNLQKTPMSDKEGVMHIFAKIDDVTELLMAKLGYDIPEFRLKRYAKMELDTKGSSETVSLSGIDYLGGPYQIFKSIAINGKAEDKIDSTRLDEFNTSFTFHAHYNEPKLEIKVPRSAFTDKTCRIEMVFDPFTRNWLAANVQDADFKNTEQLKFSFDRSASTTAPEKKAAPPVKAAKAPVKPISRTKFSQKAPEKKDLRSALFPSKRHQFANSIMTSAVARNSPAHPFLNALQKQTKDMLEDMKAKLAAVNADIEALAQRND